MLEGVPYYRGCHGGWVVYDYDQGPYPISLHMTERKAIEAMARKGYGKIAFWPLDMDFRDAINDWEKS